MYAVWALINQDCDRRVRSCVGNVLGHFFHDEWISNYKPNNLWFIKPGLLSQNCALIEFHEHHQPSIPKTLMDCSFQFSKGGRVSNCVGKLDHIRTTDGRFERRQNRFKRLGRCHGKTLGFDFPDGHHILSLSRTKKIWRLAAHTPGSGRVVASVLHLYLVQVSTEHKECK